MKYLLHILLAALLIGCCAVNKLTKKEQKMLHKKWELRELSGITIQENTPIYIELSGKNKVYGFLGCNRLSGTYEINGRQQIKFNSLATTRMACAEKAMRIEYKMLELLRIADSFSLEENKLMLYDKEGTSLATFYALSDKAVVNKYWKLKQLNGKTVEMLANQEREQYFILRSDGTFSGFAGCNHFNGTFVLDDKDRIDFNTSTAATLKSCPDGSVDEHAFLQLFYGICNFSIKGDTLIFNNTTQNSKAVFESVYF